MAEERNRVKNGYALTYNPPVSAYLWWDDGLAEEEDEEERDCPVLFLKEVRALAILD